MLVQQENHPSRSRLLLSPAPLYYIITPRTNPPLPSLPAEQKSQSIRHCLYLPAHSIGGVSLTRCMWLILTKDFFLSGTDMRVSGIIYDASSETMQDIDHVCGSKHTSAFRKSICILSVAVYRN
jgi:hypothetical protein